MRYLGKMWKKIERVYMEKRSNNVEIKTEIQLEQLEQINVDSENQTYKSEDGVLYTRDGSRLVWCPEQKQRTVTISSGTAIIGEDAFLGCEKVTDIVLPVTVTTIEKKAFEKMNSVVFWVPAGSKEFYKSLLTSENGFKDGMIIREMEQ